ncbi:MAG: hypothetical protein WCS73_07140 [Lentisphaeria bacterium]
MNYIVRNLFKSCFFLLCSCFFLLSDYSYAAEKVVEPVFIKIMSLPGRDKKDFVFPVFKEWQGVYSGVAVQNAAGEQLRARAVVVNKKFIAFAVSCQQSDLPLTCTLQASASTDAVFFPDAVFFERSSLCLTTRAFSISEMLRMINLPDFYKKETSAFVKFSGDVPSKKEMRFRWEKREGRENPLAFLRWNTNFVVPEDCNLEFGVRHSTAGWIVLLDGQPVCGWKDCLFLTNGESWSLPISVGAGIHRLQYFVFQNRGEEIPVLQQKKNGVNWNSFADAILPWYVAKEWTLSPESDMEVSMNLQDEVPWHWQNNNLETSFLKWRTETKNKGLNQKMQIAPLTTLQESEISYDNKIYHLSFPQKWQRKLEFHGTLEWGKCSEIMASDEKFIGQIVFHISPDISSALQKNLRFMVGGFDANGASIAEFVLPYNGETVMPFSVQWPPKTAVLELSAWFGTQKIFSASRMRILLPESSLKNVHAEGSFLYCGLDRVLMLYHSDALFGKNHFLKKTVKKAPWRIGYFIPDSRRGYSSFIEKGLQNSSFQIEKIFMEKQPGNLVEQADWKWCNAMASMRPDIVILNFDFGRSLTLEKQRLRFKKMQFMIQYFLSHGIEPVLITLPDCTFDSFAISAMLSRLEALYIKELGWKWGLRVIDASSAVKRERGTSFLQKDGKLSLVFDGFSPETERILSNYVRVFFNRWFKESRMTETGKE